MQKRVVVTGLGIISPVGTGLEQFWTSLTGGVSGIRRITRFDAANFSTQIAGEVIDFDPAEHMDKKEARRMDRFTQFAVAASGMAIEDANLDLETEDRDRIGVILGSGIGGIETLENQARVLAEKGPSRVSPIFVPMIISNMGAGQVAISYGLRGPNITSVSACASSSNAIGDAFKMLQWGYADVMVTGGMEAPITPLAMAGFCTMKAMSSRNEEPEKASSPFDARRDGFVAGEGAAILILESLEHALKRGARIYAEIVGYGSSCDAYHMVAPDPEGNGAVNSMKAALKDAGAALESVDYINAHATSTPLGDKAETLAIKKLFGEHAPNIAVSSTKSMTGHLLGAAGGLEAMACVLAIQRGVIPPTINYEQPDPDCDLDFVPNVARKAKVRFALSNSFGFGGHNATLAFKEYGR
ncbi:3-oxoacyl-(acyl-carrier-protein) synthase 2 [Pelotomaculum schinkii]|uniref:3-oxoacyl-[acyl-carrier-protein] synthase 2 n=1 Tax=Pelotomaculum schinkii TaxID=78350 RepID=A0A4Y7R993_9FIRM|nr:MULTISPECIES: beta-ketoacyl-ACP synthase II [Pelotomaculum]TEB05514.1 3-oxoacyl-(acyl-carrier-protein) synthase 2 [Pelotomaculum schinkii]TEB14515.1 3-oxoacyl-(acyl-carrier-protein) synthase 2 [Pelotomaculum sp. FP]